jgi:hypothetical protein
MDDERREKLLQYVAVLFEEKTKEFPRVMADDIHFQVFDNARVLHRLITNLQADYFFEGQHVGPAQIKIRVR